jgi:four helix bundle protein
MGKQGLEDLTLWKTSRDLVAYVYREVLPCLPLEERFAMAGQMRRAVQSVPANIAEAYGRFHYPDAIRFCHIARGSLEECLSHVLVAHHVGFVNGVTLHEFRDLYGRTARLLNGYLNFLNRTHSHRARPPLKDLSGGEPQTQNGGT